MKQLNKSRATIYRLIKRGRLKKKREGKKALISKRSITALINQTQGIPSFELYQRIKKLEEEIGNIQKVLSIPSKSSWVPQEVPLFKRVIQDIVNSNTLGHKVHSFRDYIRRLPIEQVASVFISTKEVDFCYSALIKYLIEQYDLEALEGILQLRQRIELIKIQITSTKPQ